MRFRWRLPWMGLVAALGCGAEATSNPVPQRELRTETDAFGLVTCNPADETHTCYTHRAIFGVSMGAHGAGALGLARPELFDTVGMLGVPLVDWTFMLRNIRRAVLGGFCEREQLLAALAEDPSILDDPERAPVCAAADPVVKLTPGGELLEPAQSFNEFYRWIDAGRGGGFGRGTIIRALQDIALALGNTTIYNPASPYLPPGVPSDFLEWPLERQCGGELAIEGIHDARFDPAAEFPKIVPCDHGGSTGVFDPRRRPEFSTEIGLAVDYNRNGKRDFAEPLIVQMWEPYEDVGCSSGNRFDWDTAPLGTAGDGRHQDCEPYQDFGLDGVPDTGDYGEGNGRFDLNPNVARYFSENPRTYIETMPAGHLERMNLYADAGIRDFLVSAGGTNWLWGALTARVGPQLARSVDTFDALDEGPGYEMLSVPFGDTSAVGQHLYVRYGDVNAEPEVVAKGDGHHVGAPSQLIERFLTAVAFADSRWLEADRSRVDDVDVLGLVQSKSYRSERLGRDRNYGVVLPPGYAESGDQTYPVLYFLHGQGQESDDLLATALLFFAYMADSNDAERIRLGQSDWGKFIIVFPDSTCDVGACRTGNFNTNHSGVTGEGPAYADAFYELMAHIERNYRVRTPVRVPKITDKP